MENVQNTATPPAKKKSKALGCGCLLLIVIGGIIALVLIFNKSGGDDKKDDPREAYLAEDLKKVTANPEETDSICYFLKPCVAVSIEGIDTDEIKYYSEINGNKLLVLLKVGDMKGIEKDSRKLLVEAVEECLQAWDFTTINEFYIGVDGNWNMLMVKTPHGSDLGGKFADRDLLLPFYDTDSSTTSQTDSAQTK